MAIPFLSRASRLLLDLVAGDVSSPANGQIWYNDTTGKFRAQEGGVVKDVIGSGGGGGLVDGDKGDVTVSGAGTILSVDPEIKYGFPIAFRQNAFLI